MDNSLIILLIAVGLLFISWKVVQRNRRKLAAPDTAVTSSEFSIVDRTPPDSGADEMAFDGKMLNVETSDAITGAEAFSELNAEGKLAPKVKAPPKPRAKRASVKPTASKKPAAKKAPANATAAKAAPVKKKAPAKKKPTAR